MDPPSSTDSSVEMRDTCKLLADALKGVPLLMVLLVVVLDWTGRGKSDAGEGRIWICRIRNRYYKSYSTFTPPLAPLLLLLLGHRYKLCRKWIPLVELIRRRFS